MLVTSRDRIMAAILNQTPSELPINVWGVPVWDQEWVRTRHPSYGPVIEVTREYGDWFANWTPPRGTFLSSVEVPTSTQTVESGDWIDTIVTLDTPGGDLTARYRSSKRGLPGLQIEYFVKDLEDVEKVLTVPYERPQPPDPSGFFALQQSIGDRGVVLAGVGANPIMHVQQLMGSELLAIWSVEQRGVVMRLLEVFLERCLDHVEAMIAAGVGPIFSTLGQEFVTPPLHSARDFHEFCTVPDRQIADRIHQAGGLLHVHCHGPLTRVLEEFVGLADVLHPVEAPPQGDVPLAEAKRRIGQHICLEGNIQIGDIYALPTPQLVELVKRAIDDGAPGGGFILCPTASPYTEVLTDLTVRNYVALVETAVEYGR